jgi:hypothetical protein
MQIQIRASKRGPLSVIEDIPLGRLSMLEGLNGIGKTLAIRILQLCAGQNPYRIDSPAWRSLCDGLGELEVKITDLDGANQIEWTADSSDWRSVIDQQDQVPFRQIKIDGISQSDDLISIRNLFTIHRLAGDEGILETFAQQADSEAAIITRWTRRYASEDSGPLSRLEQMLAHASSVLGDLSKDRYEQMVEMVEEAQRRLERASSYSEETVARRDALADAIVLRRQLDLVRRRAPNLEEQITEVDSQIQMTRRRRDETQTELMTLAGELAGAEAIVREFRNARRTLERNLESLSAELDEIAEVAAEIGVEDTPEAIVGAIEDLESLLEIVSAEQLNIDAAPTMRLLIDRVSGELGTAERNGLGEQLAIDDSETDTQLTVTQARAGMLTRRAQLEGQPPPPQAKEVAERLADVRHRLDRARQAGGALERAERFKRLAETNEQRVDTALAAMDPSITERSRELEAESRASDERLLELAARRASLRQQLAGLAGGETVESVTAKLNEALRRCGVSVDDLDNALQQAEQLSSRSQQALEVSSAEVLTAKRELARANADIQRSATALTTDPQLDWLRQGLSLSAVAIGNSPESMLRMIEVARSSIRTARTRLGSLRGQLGALRRGLSGLGQHLRGNDPATQEYLEELEIWLGGRFSSWFNIPRVRSELLPNADGNIAVNLQRREVIWVEGSTERMRPLEAFSSGDAAFAYTRARLAILDEETVHSRNRVIALDEFGAFMAFDRLAGLMAYLQERASDHPQDRVLVVLPLIRDYAVQAAEVIGPEGARLQRIADDIQRKGFTIQELLP